MWSNTIQIRILKQMHYQADLSGSAIEQLLFLERAQNGAPLYCKKPGAGFDD
jgi:hypothetical protein